MKQYTTKDFEEMKQLKKDYEEVDMELTVGSHSTKTAGRIRDSKGYLQ